MKAPGLTANIAGKNKTLYMQTVKSIEERTKENLKKTLGGKNLLWLCKVILKKVS